MLSESDFRNVTRGGQTWRYADSGQGPVVVLIHGFPDTPESYAGIARALNDAGYRTIVPYLRGYHPDTLVSGRPYDALHLAEDAIGLLDALEVQSAVLVGHDWGAMLVWGAAALAPDRVDGIVPIAIAHPRTLKPSNALQALGLLIIARHFIYFRLPWAEAGTRRGDFRYIDSLYRRWAPHWTGRERDASLARVKEAFSRPEVLEASLDYYRALGTKIDRRLLGPIACRGLLVAGGRDFGGHLGPYKKSQGLLGGGGELLVMPEAGHWPHREGEVQFTEALVEFLGRLYEKERAQT
ncbi:MAG: alpha/beta hydrolase [Deltaproteobacteria bacterium]|nr:alpha/beta hydrolase [Deltaproteobacteria bacterium]NND27716.1 alpha/beta hydrolase [Myxococcales bacterium]MBT8466194.1 alpha/beta hydrolase [Deltaproteobacteria bacterium]MBT8480024.1 alpha/beta hydrolase [Deltaproteobacteria bacterium]NNK06647.1 alpha/beta hydrolase [Myxococcales bacterium]